STEFHSFPIRQKSIRGLPYSFKADLLKSVRDPDSIITCRYKRKQSVALQNRYSRKRLVMQALTIVRTFDRWAARADQNNFGFFLKQKLTILPVLRYGCGHRKRWFKNPIHIVPVVTR